MAAPAGRPSQSRGWIAHTSQPRSRTTPSPSTSSVRRGSDCRLRSRTQSRTTWSCSTYEAALLSASAPAPGSRGCRSQRGLLADQPGQDVHAANGRLVLLARDDADVLQPWQVRVRSTELRRDRPVALGVGRLLEDLAAEEVADYLSLRRDRARRVVEPVPAAVDRGRAARERLGARLSLARGAARAAERARPRQVLAERQAVRDPRGGLTRGIDDDGRQPERDREGVLDRLQRLDRDELREPPRRATRGRNVDALLHRAIVRDSRRNRDAPPAIYGRLPRAPAASRLRVSFAADGTNRERRHE
jgi:hypothetical protein